MLYIVSMIALAFLLAGCTVSVGNGGVSSSNGNSSNGSSSNGSSSNGGSSAQVPDIGHRSKTSGCQAQGGLQDKQCTPGAIFSNATASQICRSGYSKSVRNVPVSVKDEVYAEYGITHHSAGQYEVDHLISLELGGSNDIANLWPEAASPTPGFHQKDQVENYLHDQVCSGKMDLRTAQTKIATDWLSVYKQMGSSY
ncbi:HNH endonuclease [Dictyobacter aurantiacus]|uniref:HNH endonuclease n=1 Tax=Dictyobacter aurantiacus TaxID=1936993 RepID=UPI001F37CFF7|nr:HNH endonuclease [Dictyobacter aurantiacus]